MQDKRIPVALLCLRLGVFVVMFIWTLDKFVNPDHSAKVFEHFYLLGGVTSDMFLAIGAVQMVIVLAFLAGFKKQLSYGLVLLMHTVSTLSSYKMYLDPFNGLLFFAAWPMLAACFALYSLRDLDTLWVVEKS